jgi:hypothetical protein
VASQGAAAGGRGGTVTATAPVSAGQTLTMSVGGGGSTATCDGATSSAGRWGGDGGGGRLGGKNGAGGQFGGGGGGAGGTYADNTVLARISSGTATTAGNGSITLTWQQ